MISQIRDRTWLGLNLDNWRTSNFGANCNKRFLSQKQTTLNKDCILKCFDALSSTKLVYLQNANSQAHENWLKCNESNLPVPK